jgi:2-haloacid dehalogenase
VARAVHRFASHLMRLEKPDPRVFAYVERETGYAAERILFFDDRVENVDAARAGGWMAELIDHTGDTAAQLFALLRRHRVIE